MKKVRCAIYTRKSSEEGLEQSFNSLDAQREACSAYILSQASEGWSEVAEVYDDGGLSGGTLERPALQRLLDDIAQGRIDIIVVYKVDRLTRSLLDFAKLVEAFDKAGVSFVSVTQSFNTTTSMGRLTLNMLLSFAQFEREVTAERIRDKIAASKAKGMWMGGVPPLGYRPDGRTLAIVDEHAALVREVYRRYLEIGNVRQLAEKLEAEVLIAPTRSLASGKVIGGRPLTRGQLYLMLKSPIYIGEVPHKQTAYPGQHPAIIDRETWDAVQAMLADNLQGSRRGARAERPSLLAGKVVDEGGEPLVPVHATKGKVRYRYYVSRSLQHGSSQDGLRIPAKELESAVVEETTKFLSDPLLVLSETRLTEGANWQQAIARCGDLASKLTRGDAECIRSLLHEVKLNPQGLSVALSVTTLAQELGLPFVEGVKPTITLQSEARLKRTRRAIRLVASNGVAITNAADPALIKLVAKAHRWWAELRSGTIDVTRLAAAEGVTRSYLTRVTRLALLSPNITNDILAGRLPARLGAKLLTLPGAVAPDWPQQYQALEFAGR